MLEYVLQLESEIEQVVWEEVAIKALYVSPQIHSLKYDPAVRTVTVEALGELDPAYLQAEIVKIAGMETDNLSLLSQPPLCETAREAAPAVPRDLQTLGYELTGDGRVRLTGHALQVYRQLDALFVQFAEEVGAQERSFPNLIPNETLKRCHYFTHFPQNFGTVVQVRHDGQALESFSRNPHLQMSDELLEFADLSLSPAICFHAFSESEGAEMDGDGLKVVTARGNCYRHEHKSRLNGTRLQDFTMREIVYMGAEQEVSELRNRLMDRVWGLFQQLELTGLVCTANDPFFTSRINRAVRAFQVKNDLKYELKYVGQGVSSSIASFNVHNNFFGRSFTISKDGQDAHTGCVAFGMERWVYVFLLAHGGDKLPNDLLLAATVR